MNIAIPTGKARLKTTVTLLQGISPKILGHSTIGEVFKRKTDPKNETVVKLSQQLLQAKSDSVSTYKALKERECPAFIIGKFSEKRNNCCQEYAPLLGFDIDHVADTFLLEATLNDLRKSPFVFAAFPSPSGQGLRFFVWADSTPQTHKIYYEAICANLSECLNIPTDKALRTDLKAQGKSKTEIDQITEQSEIIDTSTNNLARIWFYSHVPKDLCYLNLDSQVFVLKDLQRPHNQKTPPQPFVQLAISEDERVKICLDKIQRQNLPAGRNNFVFAFASEMCRHGVPLEVALSECASYEESDFDKSELKKTVESAYKSKMLGEFQDAQIMKYKRMVNGSTPTAMVTKPAPSKETKAEPSPAREPDNQTKIGRMRKLIANRYDLRMNMIANEIECTSKGKNNFEPLNENDLIIELLDAGFSGVEAPLIALLKSSYVPRHNPFEHYFDTLPAWREGDFDHIEHLANYVEAIDQYWFNQQLKKALVRTVACALGRIPFNKQCLTLKGEQNDGKSTFLRFLVPPALKNYTADHFDPNNKDGLFALCQNFIINLDELSQFSKADIRRVKAIFTYDQIKERLPYDRKPSSHPRRTSFVASTNDDEFLIDDTGNVRWLIFEIKGIRHDNGGTNGYSANVDINQVYAQAYALLNTGFNFHLTPEEIEKSEANNKHFQKTTTEMELIQDCYQPTAKDDINGSWVTATDIMKKIEMETKRQLNEVNIGRAMNVLGFVKGQFTPIKGASQRKGYWVKKLFT